MFRCKKCKQQSQRGQSQFRIITRIRVLHKGWEIEEELPVCHSCFLKRGPPFKVRANSSNGSSEPRTNTKGMIAVSA